MSIVAAVAVPHPPLILPEVGHGEEAKIQATIDAYRAAMRHLAAAAPETVVVTTPHSVIYSDYFHISPGTGASGDLRGFGAPGARVECEYDRELAAAISGEAEKLGVPAGPQGERSATLDHATLIPLRFLQGELPGCQVVRIGLSGLPLADHYRLGQAIAAAAHKLGRRVGIIASGDLSHKLLAEGPYGFAKEGPEYDQRVMRALGSGDFLDLLRFPPHFCEAAAECGHRSFVIMAGALDGLAVTCRTLSHEGTFGVGYGVATFAPQGEDPSRHPLADYLAELRDERQGANAAQDPYARLARETIEAYIGEGRLPPLPENLPKGLTGQRAGAFVSLHKFGELRGCIGTFLPTCQSVAEEIRQNAVSASTRDPRFPAITADELPYLEYSVDVLGAPEPIASEAELDPRRYGVIVSCRGKRGLLLPDLEGVDTVAQQVAIARRKAGIGPQEPVELQRFTVERHH